MFYLVVPFVNLDKLHLETSEKEACLKARNKSRNRCNILICPHFSIHIMGIDLHKRNTYWSPSLGFRSTPFSMYCANQGRTDVPFPFLRLFLAVTVAYGTAVNDTRKCISLLITRYTVRVLLHLFVIRKTLATNMVWDSTSEFQNQYHPFNFQCICIL